MSEKLDDQVAGTSQLTPSPSAVSPQSVAAIVDVTSIVCDWVNWVACAVVELDAKMKSIDAAIGRSILGDMGILLLGNSRGWSDLNRGLIAPVPTNDLILPRKDGICLNAELNR